MWKLIAVLATVAGTAGAQSIGEYEAITAFSSQSLQNGEMTCLEAFTALTADIDDVEQTIIQVSLYTYLAGYAAGVGITTTQIGDYLAATCSDRPFDTINGVLADYE